MRSYSASERPCFCNDGIALRVPGRLPHPGASGDSGIGSLSVPAAGSALLSCVGVKGARGGRCWVPPSALRARARSRRPAPGPPGGQLRLASRGASTKVATRAEPDPTRRVLEGFQRSKPPARAGSQNTGPLLTPRCSGPISFAATFPRAASGSVRRSATCAPFRVDRKADIARLRVSPAHSQVTSVTPSKT